MTKQHFLAGIVILLIIIGFGTVAYMKHQEQDDENLEGIGGPAISFNRFTTSSSSVSALAAGVGNRVFASSTKVAYRSVFNETAGTIYLNIDDDSNASSTYTIPILTGQRYEFIPGKNLYDGSVWATSTDGGNVQIIEVNSDD